MRLDGLNQKVHETNVVFENFRGDVAAMHDGIKAVDEKLDRFIDETRQNFAKLEERVVVVEARRR